MTVDVKLLVDKLPDAFAERFPDLRIKVDAGLNVTIVGELSPINRTRLAAAPLSVMLYGRPELYCPNSDTRVS